MSGYKILYVVMTPRTVDGTPGEGICSYPVKNASGKTVYHQPMVMDEERYREHGDAIHLIVQGIATAIDAEVTIERFVLDREIKAFTPKEGGGDEPE